MLKTYQDQYFELKSGKNKLIKDAETAQNGLKQNQKTSNNGEEIKIISQSAPFNKNIDSAMKPQFLTILNSQSLTKLLAELYKIIVVSLIMLLLSFYYFTIELNGVSLVNRLFFSISSANFALFTSELMDSIGK